jgi:hypothetical protein
VGDATTAVWEKYYFDYSTARYPSAASRKNFKVREFLFVGLSNYESRNECGFVHAS